jgi:uncharacterized protein YdcH (DUF465 family)
MVDHPVKKIKILFVICIIILVYLSPVQLNETKRNNILYYLRRIDMKTKRILNLLNELDEIMTENTINKTDGSNEFIQIVRRSKINQKDMAINSILQKIRNNGQKML